MDITITIIPSATLTPEHLIQVESKAAALGIKSDQFIVEAILAKLNGSSPPQAVEKTSQEKRAGHSTRAARYGDLPTGTPNSLIHP